MGNVLHTLLTELRDYLVAESQTTDKPITMQFAEECIVSLLTMCEKHHQMDKLESLANATSIDDANFFYKMIFCALYSAKETADEPSEEMDQALFTIDKLWSYLYNNARRQSFYNQLKKRCLTEPAQHPQKKRCPRLLRLPLGADTPINRVSYANVPKYKQVPGLCEYVDRCLDKIKEMAKKIFAKHEPNRLTEGNDFGYLRVKLSCVCRMGYSNDKTDKQIAQDIVDKSIENGEPLSVEQVLELIQQREFEDRMLGCFTWGKNRPQITIYYMNFHTSSYKTFYAMIFNTLAHEYMHYFEHLVRRRLARRFTKNKIVSEAMADFFALLCSVFKHDSYSLEVAQKRYNLWLKRQNSNWPYSCALYFFLVNGRVMNFSADYNDYVQQGSVEKLNDVLGHYAYTSVSRALNVLYND